MKRGTLPLAILALLCPIGMAQAVYLSTPQPFTPGNSTNGSDWRVVFSPDNLSFYVESERDGHFANGQILRATRPTPMSSWGTPTAVTELNTSTHDHFYWISQDQKEAFLCRHGNPVPGSFSDIYRTTRASASDPWGTPTLVPEFSGPDFKWHLHLTTDGLVGVFSTTRAGGGGGSFDLWQTTRSAVDGAWSTPVPLTTLNTSAQERGPQLSADGLTLYFCRLNLGLFRATRPSLDSPFSAPEFLGINAIDPTLSVDEKTLYYAMQSGGYYYHIYHSTIVPEPMTAVLISGLATIGISRPRRREGTRRRVGTGTGSTV